VITAEEMATIFDAPFDPPSSSVSDTDGSVAATSTTIVSESWVLPALIQFGGEPVVGEDGNIYYKFEV
jgi:hypothetical protein